MVEAKVTVARLKDRYGDDTRWVTIAATAIVEVQGSYAERSLQCDLIHAWLIPEDFCLPTGTSRTLHGSKVGQL